MEKKVMVRLCVKIVAETDLYETDTEVQNLIDWVYRKLASAVVILYILVENKVRKWYNLS